MKERFEGLEGKRRLVSLLREQDVVGGDVSLASALADVGSIQEYKAGEVLIKQGDEDNHICLILSGSCSISVNRRELTVRRAGQHVGEMALMDPGERRSATVVAQESACVLCVAEADFVRIGNANPEVWARIGRVLARRLRERSKFVRMRNETPILFLGSSRESLPIARVIREGLRNPFLIARSWTDGVFGASRFPIEDLEAQIQEADFAALVLGPDDRVASRGKEQDAPRDNVIFELGLFMGACGRHRTFLIVPRDLDLKIPSDLLGLTPLTYELGSANDLAGRLEVVCRSLDAITANGGPR